MTELISKVEELMEDVRDRQMPKVFKKIWHSRNEKRSHHEKEMKVLEGESYGYLKVLGLLKNFRVYEK